MVDRPAGGHSQRPDHPRGNRQDAGRPARGGAGRRPGPSRSCGRRSSRSRRPRPAGPAGPGGDPTRRPVLDVLLRYNPAVEPETLPGLAVGAGSSKFGLADDELAAAIEAGGGAARAAHAGEASTSTSARSWAPSMPGGTASAGHWRSSGCSAARCPHFDTLDVGGGFPVFDLEYPGSRPGALRPGARPAPRGAARRSPAGPAGGRAGPLPRRPGRLSRRPGPPCSRNATGRWSSSMRA